MLTSDSPAPGHSRAAAAWFVYGVWLVMTLAAFVYVARFTHNLPLWDEWEFVPALTHEEPFWPWLWVQHNEHRLPLPRAIYFGLFELTHDFRTGSWVQVIGLSLLALGMISLARRGRGRLAFADAFFPIALLNWGHYENYQMGYQICFVLIAALAGGLLAVVLTAAHGNLFRRGVQAGLLTILLALCGAAGLAFAPPMALWLLALAAWIAWGARSAPPDRPGAPATGEGEDPSLALRAGKPPSRSALRAPRSALLILLAALPLAYIPLYFHGYERPAHHPESAGVLPSAVIGLEFLTVSVGLPVSNAWPAAGLVVALLALATVGLLGRVAVRRPEERPRALGLLLFLGAMAALAFGIGWGRSGFGHSDMGFASRYALLAWPALAAVYLVWVRYGGTIASRVVPAALFAVVVVMLPFNVGTGWMIGEEWSPWWSSFETDVRSGVPPEVLVEKYFPGYSVAYRVHRGVRLMRDHGISYFPALKEGVRIDLPPAPDRLEHAGRDGDLFRCASGRTRLVYALDPPRFVHGLRAELSYLDRPDEYKAFRVFWTQPDGTEGSEVVFPDAGTGEQAVTVPVGRMVAELRIRPDQSATVCRVRRLTLVVRGD